jgi:solute carrier family 30 (zinc transporter), member 9
MKTDQSLNAVLAAITGNFCVAIAKTIGWVFSGSPSMLAEAIHSFADTANQALLFIGIRHSSGKPTPYYPWGKGQARYVWNLVSALGIFFVGFGVTTYHGVNQLVSAHDEPVSTTLLPVFILLFSLLVEGWTLWVAYNSVNRARGDTPFWQYLKSGDDPTGVAVLLEDSIAVFGVTIAFIGYWMSRNSGSHLPDAITSIIIGCLLGIMAIALAIANGRILIGASAGKEWDTEIREFVESFPSVERVVNLRTAVLSPGSLRVSIEVEFHGGMLLNRQQIEEDAERIREGEDPTYILVETAERMVRTVGREINRLEAELHKKFPEVVMIDLEVN